MSTRCFLPHCPCGSTSPQNSDIIDVEPCAAINAHDPDAEVVVYRCSWDTQHSPCGMFIEGAPRDILSHFRERHGIAMYAADADVQCRWSPCSMDRHLKMNSIARHIAWHLGIQFRCSRCGLTARDDVVRDHIRRNPGCADAVVQLVPGSGARRIVSA
ncbi:uncharacterized protein EDB93DRAFT_731668 [Suillus bovinus]|uniref:uncharacterized protein n=1 Tax=Suillus bovinus TaxID=48563 RepID=UPI001B870924|nr:uncharacterized protein EDB93DRAFT_731668 [Suillus bovinus]KAG2157881.1 hypothetical protein EDB93DRAFT_731668 [Suillus bovinus]